MPPQDKKEKVDEAIVHELTSELRPGAAASWNPKGDVSPVTGTIKRDEKTGHLYREITYTFDAKSPAHPECLKHCDLHHIDPGALRDAIEQSLRGFAEQIHDPKSGVRTVRFRRVGPEEADKADVRYFHTSTVPPDGDGKAVGHVHNEDQQQLIVTTEKPHKSHTLRTELVEIPRDVVIANIFTPEQLKPGGIGFGTVDHENGHMLGLAHTNRGAKIDSLMSSRNATQTVETKTADGMLTQSFRVVVVQSVHPVDAVTLGRMYSEPVSAHPSGGHGLPARPPAPRSK